MAEDKSIIQVGMIGFGTVGQGVYRLLEKNRPEIEAKIGAQIRIKKIIDKDWSTPAGRHCARGTERHPI